MAYSKCPKCENTSFELVTTEPALSKFKLNFVQCSRCGCVVGTMEYYNIGAKISELEKKIDGISLGDSSVNNNLNVINQNIAKLFNLIKTLK